MNKSEAEIILESLEAIVESARDGREIPEWLMERLVPAEAAIKRLHELRDAAKSKVNTAKVTEITESASQTPTLDKFNLHTFGGRCTCFSHPYSVCTTCEAIRSYKSRWAALSPENRNKAELEMKIYETSNQDGR